MVGFLAFFSILGLFVIYYDLKERRIPNKLNICFFIGFSIYIWVEKLSLFKSLFAMGIVLILFLFIYGVTKGGIGEGDIKLVVPLAGIIGVDYVLDFLLLASIISFPVALFFYLKKNQKKYEIPFGPFLIFSFLITFIRINL